MITGLQARDPLNDYAGKKNKKPNKYQELGAETSNVFPSTNCKRNFWELVAQAHPQLTTRPAHVVLGISHLVLAVLVGQINRVSGVFRDLYNSVIPQYHCGLYVRYLFLSPLFCILEKKKQCI